MKYQHGNIWASVFHGRHSYELGFEIEHEGEMFPLSALIRVVDPEAASRYRRSVARTAAEVATGLEKLAHLVRHYADQALRGDASIFVLLRDQQRAWSGEYALDVLARQIRPRAEEAFRQGRFRDAADLYTQIRTRLSQAEIKKLEYAIKRSQSKET